MLFRYFIVLSLFLGGWSCQPPGAEEATPEKSTGAPELTAQALLLTQPFAYDAEDKNRVSAAYQANEQLTVPADLAPQNKWIMFEGPVLENDKIAYRYYADSRHRFDIYGKTVADLVMDTISWKYHDIMNWGSDILKVGNSLGMGSPGIWYQDSVYTLSDCAEKQIEVISTGTATALVRTTFKGLKVGEETFDLIQDWSLTTGNYWSQIDLRVVGGTLPEGMAFVTGIVKHLPEIMTSEENGFVCAYNWGTQSYHEEDMGMAVMASSAYAPRQIDDKLSHLLVFENAPAAVTYRFMAIWERDQSGTRGPEAFKKMVIAATQ